MLLSQTSLAREIAERAHSGQVDKAGRPYIEHPAAVAEKVTVWLDTDDAVAAAWLHDVVEDTPTTFEDLKGLGVNDAVIEALRLLTHDKSVPYFDYVRALKANSIARAVKMADLVHNMNLERLPKITDVDLERCQKYSKAMDILMNE